MVEYLCSPFEKNQGFTGATHTVARFFYLSGEWDKIHP